MIVRIRFSEAAKSRLAKICKNVGIALVCLCVLSYSVFHVSSLFSEEIGTIVVGPTTEKTTTSLGGYVFRNATPIYSEKYNGAVDYLVKNGEKVSAKQKLATVYEEGNSSSVASLIAVMDEQIELLLASTADRPSVSQITALRKSASSAYYAIMKQLASGMSIAPSAEEKKLLVSLNSIAMLTEEDFGIKETLDELLVARENILSAGGDSEEISTDKSGYFYTSVDGYEGSFTGTAATELDREGFLSLFDSPERKEIGGECIGKMSYDSTWYFAAEIDSDEANVFTEGKRYEVDFTSGGLFEVDMTVDRILVDEGEERAVIVFKSNVLPEGFNFRRQTAKIVTDSVSGIYVPVSAVHRENYTKVVYILKGSVVQLRHIDVIYEGSDYYIVSEEGKDDGRVYLRSNEQLIVRGSNLFDGRILG